MSYSISYTKEYPTIISRILHHGIKVLDLEIWQKFTAALLSHAVDQMKAGKSVDDATASFSIDKFPGYKKERVKGSIQAVYDELKK